MSVMLLSGVASEKELELEGEKTLKSGKTLDDGNFGVGGYDIDSNERVTCVLVGEGCNFLQ
jgi:hypothetical protein